MGDGVHRSGFLTVAYIQSLTIRNIPGSETHCVDAVLFQLSCGTQGMSTHDGPLLDGLTTKQNGQDSRPILPRSSTGALQMQDGYPAQATSSAPTENRKVWTRPSHADVTSPCRPHLRTICGVVTLRDGWDPGE